MGQYIEKQHGHWQLTGGLRELLLECRGNDNTRYALTAVYVADNVLAATDGRRLVEIQYKHKITRGNYFCTTDGFLLPFVDDERFPDYKKIIPAKDKLRAIVQVDETTGENVVGLILGELCHAGCIIALTLYEKVADVLSENIDGAVTVFVSKEHTGDHPFVIEADTKFGHLRYIQMPINVKNEVQA